MLAFVTSLFALLGRSLKVVGLKWLGENFPGTLYKARKYIGRIGDNFRKYVSCPSCHYLYPVGSCIIHTANRQVSKLCDYVRFPNHSMISRRAKCNSVLTLWLPRAPNGALKMPGLISHVVPRSTQQPQRLYPVYFAHVLTSVLIYIL